MSTGELALAQHTVGEIEIVIFHRIFKSVILLVGLHRYCTEFNNFPESHISQACKAHLSALMNALST